MSNVLHCCHLVVQLVAKWRAISSAHRKEGVQLFYQGIRQKHPRQDTDQDNKVPLKPVRPGQAGILKTGQDAVNKLYDNGYIRPKMIRIRLLHYWICRLIGASSSAVQYVLHPYTGQVKISLELVLVFASKQWS